MSLSSSPSLRSPSARGHLRFIDALRGWAALYVVIHHGVYSVFGESEVLGPWMERWVRALSNGHTAVVAFIVISGFCLGWPLAQRQGEMGESVAQFLVRRAKRILPPFWVALAFGAVMGSTVVAIPMGTGREWDNAIPFDWRAVLMHASLVGDVYAPWTDKVNHPLWSVEVESKIYLCLPLMAWALRHGGLWRTLAGVSLAAAALWGGLSWLQHQPHTAWINLGPSGVSPHFLVAFFFGVLVARQAAVPRLEHRLMGWGRETWTLMAVWLVVAVGLGLVASRLPAEAEQAGRFMLRDLSKAALFSMLIVCLMRLNVAGRVDRAWGVARLGAPLGRVSYSLYLTHAPIIEWVMRSAGAYGASAEWRVFVTAVLAPAVALVFAVMFYAGVERPCHAWARQRSAAETARQQAVAETPRVA